MKKVYKIGIIIIVLLCVNVIGIVFISQFTLAQSVDITYNFERNILYEQDNLNYTNSFNVRNRSYYNGHYPATYSFTNEVGKEEVDIEGVGTVGGSGEINVVKEVEGHEGVLNITSDGGVGYKGFYTPYFDADQSNGVIEFWFRCEASADIRELYVREGGTICISVRASGGKFRARDGANEYEVAEMNINQWYHLRYKWYSDDTYDVFIDRAQVVASYSFRNPTTDGLNRMWFRNYHEGSDMYLDAIGYSWDSEYNPKHLLSNLENNKQEPLNTELNVYNDNNTLEIIDFNNTDYCETIINVSKSEFNLDFKTDYSDYETESPHINIELWYENDRKGYLRYGDAGFGYSEVSYYDGSTSNTIHFDPLPNNYISNVSMYINCQNNTILLEVNTTNGNEKSHYDLITESIDYIKIRTFDSADNIHYFIYDFSYDFDKMGKNLISEQNITNIVEVDKQEFAFKNPNKLTNPTQNLNVFGWNEIETDDTVDFTSDNSNYGYDNVVQLANYKVGGVYYRGSGMYKNYSINTITPFNISTEFYFPENDISGATLNISIYNYNKSLTAKLQIYSYSEHNLSLRYFDGSEYIEIQKYLDKQILSDFNTFNLNLYFDKVLSIRFSYDNEFQSLTHIPLLDNGIGLSQIKFVSNISSCSNLEFFEIYVDNIGIFENGTSLIENEYAYYTHNINTQYDSETFNLCKIENTIPVALAIFETNLDDLDIIFKITNNNSISNVYDYNYESSNSILYISFKNNYTYSLYSYLSIEGVKLTNTQNENEVIPSYKLQSINQNKSYWYVDNNRLYYYHYANSSNTEYNQITFNIADKQTTNYSLYTAGLLQNNEFILSNTLIYTDTSTESELFNYNYLSTIIYKLEHFKTIDKIRYTISDNDNIINYTTVSGYISSLKLGYSGFKTFELFLTDFINLFPILIIWLIPAFATYFGIVEMSKREKNKKLQGTAKQFIIPLLLVSTIILYMLSYIPFWLLFVMMFSQIGAMLTTKYIKNDKKEGFD